MEFLSPLVPTNAHRLLDTSIQKEHLLGMGSMEWQDRKFQRTSQSPRHVNLTPTLEASVLG